MPDHSDLPLAEGAGDMPWDVRPASDAPLVELVVGRNRTAVVLRLSRAEVEDLTDALAEAVRLLSPSVTAPPPGAARDRCLGTRPRA